MSLGDTIQLDANATKLGEAGMTFTEAAMTLI
jgi:hypothetical protein